MAMTMIEKLERALVNRRNPNPYVEGVDAFDVLKEWAEFDPATAKPGMIGYRAHPDNFSEAKRELEEARADACAVLDALQEPTEEMVRDGWEAMLGGEWQNCRIAALDARDCWQAMLNRAKGDL